MKNHFTPTLIDYLLLKTKDISEDSLKSILACKKENLSAIYLAKYERVGVKDLSTIYFVYDLIDYHCKLEKKKETFLERIQKIDHDDKDLKCKISEADSLFELESYFAPFKRRSNVKASKARGAGLSVFSDEILKLGLFEKTEEDLSLEVRAKDYQNVEKGFTTYDEILKGVQYILSYKALCHSHLRKEIKRIIYKGSIELEKGDGLKNASKNNRLIGYKEFLKNLNSPKNVYRFLQIIKAQKQKELKISLKFDEQTAISRVRKFFGYKEVSSVATFLNYCSKVTLTNHLAPSLFNEIFEEFKERAERKVLEIFSFQVKKLLSRKGTGPSPVLSVWTSNDGSFSLMVLVGSKGEFISHTTIDLSKREEIKKLVIDLNKKLPLKALVMNRSYRPQYNIFKEMISSFDFPLVMLNPQNALAFLKLQKDKEKREGKNKEKKEKNQSKSVSDEEKKCLNLALFLARELQNPFLQLSQLSPETSFGFPFNELPVEKTRKIFQRRFEEALAKEGLDLNEAPEVLLKKVCGIDEVQAQEIVKKCPFETLKKLSEILSDKDFKQAACFLRLSKSSHILDTTDLHPRHYAVVWDMIKSLKLKSDDVLKPIFKEKIEVEKQKWIKILGKNDYYQIINTLQKTPKEKKFKAFYFSEDLNEFQDLKEDKVYWGQIQSVAPFGFFIDLGLDIHGFMPLKEIVSDQIKRPLSYLSRGDWLQVSLRKMDLEKKQFSLKRAFVSKKALPKTSYKSSKKKKKPKFSETSSRKHKEVFNNPFEQLQKLKGKL